MAHVETLKGTSLAGDERVLSRSSRPTGHEVEAIVRRLDDLESFSSHRRRSRSRSWCGGETDQGHRGAPARVAEVMGSTAQNLGQARLSGPATSVLSSEMAESPGRPTGGSGVRPSGNAPGAAGPQDEVGRQPRSRSFRISSLSSRISRRNSSMSPPVSPLWRPIPLPMMRKQATTTTIMNTSPTLCHEEGDDERKHAEANQGLAPRHGRAFHRRPAVACAPVLFSPRSAIGLLLWARRIRMPF